MKTFLNNKKIPFIPAIYYNNNHITDFKEKAQIFNNFFAKQSTLVENNSKLSTDSFKRTDNFLSTISFIKAKIIKNLNPNKAHGFNMISIRMLKICGDSILKPLELTLKPCIEKFLIAWKKGNGNGNRNLHETQKIFPNFVQNMTFLKTPFSLRL